MNHSFLLPDEEQRMQGNAVPTAKPTTGFLLPDEQPAAERAAPVLRQALPINPDKAGQTRALANRSGMPESVVERNFERVQAEDKLKGIQDAMRLSPVLARQMADPAFAKLAHDDVDNLTAVGGSIKPSTGPKPGVMTTIAGIVKALPQGAEGWRQGLRMQFADMFDFTAMREDAARKAATVRNQTALSTPEFESTTAKGVYSGLTSVVRQAPAIALSVLTGSPLPALAAAGVQSEAEAYTKYRDRGASPAMAGIGAIGEGATEVLTEMAPMAFLTKKLGKVGAGEFLMGLLGREIPGEQVATLVQDAIDTAIANPDKTWAQYAAERPAAAYQTLVSTVTQAGVMAGAGSVMRRLSNPQPDAANNDATAMEQLIKLAEASKVRERDPSSFKAFVDAAAEDGPVQDIRVNANVFAQAAGENLETLLQSMPSVAEQITEAAAVDGELVIPLGEFATAIPGTGLESALIDHIRTAPDAMTREEAKTFMQSGADELRADTEKLMAEKGADDAFKESAAKVEATLLGELETANRFTADVNKPYAQLAGAFYQVQAARLGITPEEMYARYPLKVASVIAGGGRVMEQGPTSKGFKKWFDDSKVVDDAGKPQVVYHGTFSDVKRFSKAKRGRTVEEAGQTGFFFTNDAAEASLYADPKVMTMSGQRRGGNVMPVFLNIQNPAAIEIEDAPGVWWDRNGEQAYADALAAGQDGVIVRSTKQTQVMYVAFEPTQIKSAIGNDGTFDANDTSILSQSTRGRISFADDITKNPSVITLLANADLSTFVHELGHFQLEVLASIAGQPNAPAEIVADMNALLKWFGISDLNAWNNLQLDEKRPYHEQLARGFEAYIFEGKTPSNELQGVFQRMRAWMVNVYRSLTNLNVTLNDEVRGVFDRLIATNEQILEAEQARGYAPLFKTAEEMGATPAEWQAYQAQHLERTQDAVDMLQTRSLRDMKWLSNARNDKIKELQKDAKAKRNEVEAEVTAEVNEQPVWQADAYLKRAGGTEPSSDLAVEDGVNTIAEMFGFRNAEHLREEIRAAGPKATIIEGMTDQRMLERYGDLTDQRSIERAADAALANEAHVRALMTEHRALAKATTQNHILAKAAKQFAAQIIGSKVLKRLSANHYITTAARSGRAAEKATNLVEKATHKRNQIVQTYAARAAQEAIDDTRKGVEFFRRVVKNDNTTIAKTRDVDVVMAARAILAEYGIGTKGKSAQEYLKAVEAYDPAMYNVLRDRVDALTVTAKPYEELTVDEFRALRDEIDAMWHLARRSRQMEVDGDLMDREDVQDDLRARMDVIGIPDRVPGEGSAVTEAERRIAQLQTARAALRRVESWVGVKDGDAPTGAFRKFVWQPVKDAADRYRADKAKYLKRYRDLLENIAPTLAPGKIDAPELGYTFGNSRPGGKAELLHAILHAGNASNKKKSLLGRKWASENADGSLDTTRWDAFIKRMWDTGVLTKQDYDFAQGVWDLLKEMTPLAQKTHRDVFGHYFDEVTAESFETPFGTYAGGYVPALADAEVVTDAKTRALAEEENSTLAFAFPTTNKGFTKARVDAYTKPLLLDLRSLSQHIDKVLLFSHLEQPIRDVRRVLTANKVAYALNRIDPAAFDGLLTPWLNRTARQQVETPIAGSGGLMRFFSAARSRAGMAAMFANVSNTAQQITGFSLAAVKVRPRYLKSALVDYVRSPKKFTEAVSSASAYMSTRMDQEVAQMTDAINDILLNPSVYEKAQAWSMKHAYFLQAAVDNVMSPIVWTGAYNQALEQGLNERDAQRLADGTVRETQGSTLPEDVSRIESGNAFVRMFTQFAGYFNMQANMLGSEFAKVAQGVGLKQGAGRGFYVLLFGMLVPAWSAELIAQAFKGGPEDEDDDGYLDDWLASVFGFGTLRNATAMVPVVGQVINATVNTANSKPYDDRISTAPAVSMIESAVRAPQSVYKAIFEDGKPGKAIKDVATLLSLTVGVPVSAIARPISYLADIAADKVDPTGPVDAVRGTVTGAVSPESKR